MCKEHKKTRFRFVSFKPFTNLDYFGNIFLAFFKSYNVLRTYRHRDLKVRLASIYLCTYVKA